MSVMSERSEHLVSQETREAMVAIRERPFQFGPEGESREKLARNVGEVSRELKEAGADQNKLKEIARRIIEIDEEHVGAPDASVPLQDMLAYIESMTPANDNNYVRPVTGLDRGQ